MNYAVTYRNIVLYLIPAVLRQSRLRDLLYAAIKPLQDINDNFVTWKAGVDKIIQHNGQVVCLERYLNTEYSLSYDPATRTADIAAGTIIYIEDQANTAHVYLYNKVESQTVYAYNKYQSGTTYNIDDRVRYSDKVYRSKVGSNTGNTPDTSTAEWEEESDFALFLRTNAEYADDLDFKVKVPATLVYDEERLKAQVNQLRMAGSRYTIETY